MTSGATLPENAVSGAFGLISYAFTGGKRDFLSRSQITAERYDLHCDAGVLGQARSILGISAFDTPQPPETPEAH